MSRLFKSLLFNSFAIVAALSLFACKDEVEDIRTPDDLIGMWQTAEDPDFYYDFKVKNIVTSLTVEYQDDMSIGKWGEDDVYYYEPGYELVIYLNGERVAQVYQLVEYSNTSFTWCWVDKIVAEGGREGITKAIGEIINKAQEGYQLNPALYKTFYKLSEEQYLDLLNSLDIIYNPWEYEH